MHDVHAEAVMSYEEIASRLGLRRGQVKWAIMKALKKISQDEEALRGFRAAVAARRATLDRREGWLLEPSHNARRARH